LIRAPDSSSVLGAGIVRARSSTPSRSPGKGGLGLDRQFVERLNASIEPEADLRVVAAAADQVSAQLQQVLQREDLHCRVQLRTTTANRTTPRVR